MGQSEAKKIIGQLQKKKIEIFDVPTEYENHPLIVTFEREMGLRVTGKRGFDIISNSFFVEEELIYTHASGREQRKDIFLSFGDFDLYFDFLNGDIYDNACYTFCHLPEDVIASRKIDMNRLMERKAFIDKTIDDYSLSATKEEMEHYKKAERIHKNCQRWIKRFNSCNTYDEFVKTAHGYKKSSIAAVVDINFFIFNYIFENTDDKIRFNIVIEYISSEGVLFPDVLASGLCSIYDPDDIIQKYTYPYGVKNTKRIHKSRVRTYIKSLRDNEIEFRRKAFFDKETNYYCVEVYGYDKNGSYYHLSKICIYFDTFEEFANHLNGDLTYTDLSSALKLNVDFSKYKTDETTILPGHMYNETTYSLKKQYANEKFHVTQQWKSTLGNVIKEYEHNFDFFFDFVSFLKGDLSDADLLFCDGLTFLRQWNAIDFKSAKIKSSLCEKFGLEYDLQEFNTELLYSFQCTEQCEKETESALYNSRSIEEVAEEYGLSSVDAMYDHKCQRVEYISDLHILHMIKNANCRSKEDCIYVIQKIVRNIASEVGSLLLIGGDVASDFNLFQLFVKLLSNELRKSTVVVFVLGNHDLWSFPDLSLDEIVLKYRTFLDEYGMYLLQNDILYKEGNSVSSCPGGSTFLIKYNELCKMDNEQIFERLKRARYVILGGNGFSGYNMEFNADDGIYRGTIDRCIEIDESKRFENLYNRLHDVLIGKNTIILTHTPKKDWCAVASYDENLIYVNGHTHRNFFHDDGVYRVYSDNQIGYRNINPHLKSFLVDNEYDCFADYVDGIYEITREQYKDFHRGKNIPMNFNREINIIYMLKKNGYYCFIHKSKEDRLALLYGGAIKNLENVSVQYYYNNMDTMISKIKSPLDKFSEFQKHIADMVKKIGGSGKIHGSIIDIDYYNHIYVNPIDFTVTGYWAENIINKIVYPSISALLEKNCPQIFDKYIKYLEQNNDNSLILKQQMDITSLPQTYLDTDIYRASREIKKMQRLNSNILTTWYRDALSKRPRIELT